jgi:hypothetical protein
MRHLETLFLDAGGVLVFPNWTRVVDTLSRHGITVSADALAAAEPWIKHEIDQGIRDGNSTDAQRAWMYMEMVLEKAGVAPGEAPAAAVRELRAYHAEHNLWESVPADVGPALERLAGLGTSTASATPISSASRSRIPGSSGLHSTGRARHRSRRCT